MAIPLLEDEEHTLHQSISDDIFRRPAGHYALQRGELPNLAYWLNLSLPKFFAEIIPVISPVSSDRL